jgi:hypothetical protein
MSAVCDQLTEQQAEFFKTLLAQMRFEMRRRLSVIQSQRLWRESHPSFADFVEAEFGRPTLEEFSNIEGRH